MQRSMAMPTRVGSSLRSTATIGSLRKARCSSLWMRCQSEFRCQRFIARSSNMQSDAGRVRVHALRTGLRSEAAGRMGVVQKTVPPEQLLDAAVAWAAHVTPDCYPAYSISKRSLQATTMAAIDAAARLDLDQLSRGTSDPKSLRMNARRYRELRERRSLGRCPRDGFDFLWLGHLRFFRFWH